MRLLLNLDSDRKLACGQSLDSKDQMDSFRKSMVLAFWLALVALSSGLMGASASLADHQPDPAHSHASSNRMCAEWEPALGTLIRWPLGIPSQLVTELAEDDSLYVLVENQSEQNQAVSTFQSWGVNTENCRFIRAATYSHWTRDWGPHSVFDRNGDMMIMDPLFDGYPWVPGGKSFRTVSNASRGWEEDDLVNGVLASELSCSLLTLPAYLTGGNIMVDGMGTAFSTQQMIDENAPLWSESEFLGLLEDYAGLNSYHILSNTENHGIQHIDCAAKLLNEQTVLIQELPSWHPEKWRMDRLVSEFESITNCYGDPYKIVRVYCAPYDGNATAAYTNSLILNDKVLVPTFGVSSDSLALETYRQALPGYEVISFYYSSWYYYDALHCRTMAIFDRHMLRLIHCPLDSAIDSGDGFRITASIDDRSEAGLVPDRLQVKWRQPSESSWDSITLSPVAVDSFEAVIPSCCAGTGLEYYIQAADSSGRFEVRPRGAPTAFYTLEILPGPVVCGDVDDSGSGPDIADLVYLVTYMFDGGPAPAEFAACDVDGNSTAPDIADLVYLVSYMFQEGPDLACP